MANIAEAAKREKQRFEVIQEMQMQTGMYNAHLGMQQKYFSMAAQQSQQMRVLNDQGMSACPPLCTDEPYVSKLRKCPKCGRSKQTPTHNTCDGCGAPKMSIYHTLGLGWSRELSDMREANLLREAAERAAQDARAEMAQKRSGDDLERP